MAKYRKTREWRRGACFYRRTGVAGKEYSAEFSWAELSLGEEKFFLLLLG